MSSHCIAIMLALAGTLALTVAAQAKNETNLVTNPGFESGLSGWKTAGAAEFAVDHNVRHGGRSAARVTVDPQAKLEFQNISYSLPVKPGEALRVRLWVRCAEPTDGSGVYGALEFLDGDKRVVTAHTDLPSTRLTPNSWLRLEAWAIVPEAAKSVRILCVCNSHGTAWFDDAELVRIEPAPGPDSASVALDLRQKEVISDQWQGFGCQGDLFLQMQRTIKQGVNDEDRKLVRNRILAMRPKLVRLAVGIADWEMERGKHTPDSEAMRDLRETLAIYKEAGAEIQLTEWGYALPPWCRPEKQLPHQDERRAFTDSWASLVKYLRQDCGFTNIRYVTLYNEPNQLDWKGYSAVYRALDASLKAEGIRKDVSIVGPDEACENLLVPRAVKELDDVIDYYDAHNYTSNIGREFAFWTRTRIELMPRFRPPSKGEAKYPARKRFLITEFGMLDGMDTWFNPHNHEYNYGIFVADSAIVSCNEGVSGMSVWCLMDTDYGQRMKWGLWRFRDENWEPRPGFYSWSLITRYTELRSTIHRIASDSPNVVATALRAPNRGLWTLMAVNRAGSARTVKISGLPAGSKWEEFVYSEKSVPTPDRGMIGCSARPNANADGEMVRSLPPQSFVLWHEVRL